MPRTSGFPRNLGLRTLAVYRISGAIGWADSEPVGPDLLDVPLENALMARRYSTYKGT